MKRALAWTGLAVLVVIVFAEIAYYDGPLAFALVVLVGYFIPTAVGKMRGVANLGSIFVINLFLGWTLIGWVVALAMAARTVPAPQPSR